MLYPDQFGKDPLFPKHSDFAVVFKDELAEMNDYGSTLRSLTGGRAKFSMKFSDYQLVPANVQQELVKKHAAEKVEA